MHVRQKYKEIKSCISFCILYLQRTMVWTVVCGGRPVHKNLLNMKMALTHVRTISWL